MEERLSREASLAIHHEFEVDDELESNDGYFNVDRLSSNDLENVSKCELHSNYQVYDARIANFLM